MIKNNSFTFIVFTFNHEKYIIEYLESVKYQIETYGSQIQVKLIIADDCSSDNTVPLINLWFKDNRQLFFDIIFIKNKQNLGTCNNFINTWEKVTTGSFHFCAGDDLYSFENIFELASITNRYDVASYMPLYLTDGIIKINYKAVLGLVSSNIIYKSFIDRVRNINFLFAPCLFYNHKIIKNEKISSFIKSFRVVEDLPLQVMIGEEYTDLKFKEKYNILLYYRRTSNSTYLIRNNDFSKDKIKILEYMVNSEQSFINKILIKNRIFCFKSNSIIIKSVLNFNYYIYFIRSLLKIFPIFFQLTNIKIDVNKHRSYYDSIRLKADRYSYNK